MNRKPSCVPLTAALKLHFSSILLTFHIISWSHFILRRKCQPKNKQSHWKGSRWKQKSVDTLIQSEEHFLYLPSTSSVSLYFCLITGVSETPRSVLTHWNKIHFSRLLIPGGNHLLELFRSSRIYWKYMWVIYIFYLIELRVQLILRILKKQTFCFKQPGSEDRVKFTAWQIP